MDKLTREQMIIEEIIERAHKEAFDYKAQLKRMSADELHEELNEIRRTP